MWLFVGAAYQGGDDAEARGIDEQPLPDKHHWFNVEKPAVPGNSNLKTQHQVLC